MPSMPRLFPLALLFLFLLGDVGFSQQNPLYFTQHRPAGINWKELKSPHFRIIFAEGHEEIARRSARILESQYDQTYELTGGSLKNFPVVLSPYNDVTNGFVSSTNFRSEVDLSPFKGKSLNPQSGLWMETVLPHELLHANHANVTNKASIASAIGLLGPDLRRSFNMFPPLGVHEGLAVYHESEHGIREYSGRSNYTYFQNQFNANLAGPNTWNMGQNLIISDYSQPGDRHYMGGANFTKWLHQTYGDDISKRAIRVHQNLFFLGYGYALRKVTGKWPGELYEEYQASLEHREDERTEDLAVSTDDDLRVIESSLNGVRQQRPIWLNDREIVVHSRQYNAPGAFYQYNLADNSFEKISEHFLVSDYYMDYDEETNHLFIAENFSINRVFSNYQTDLVRLNLTTGSQFRISTGQRLYAPDKSSTAFYALQPDGDISNIVKVESESIEPLTSFVDKSAVVVKASPHNPGELAVVLNQRGIQALWIVDHTTIDSELNGLPDLAFKNGSIHDISWHPSNNKILFSMDAFPAMNIYEYDLESGSIQQITNSRYNAMEADYSPDGSSIALISQIGNERKLAILHRDDFYNRSVETEALLTGSALSEALSIPILGDDLIEKSSSWEISDYGKDFSWLKPRAILPVAKEKSGVTEWGAALYSTDVLQSQLYSLEVTSLQDRFWYNINYTNKTFYPGLNLSTYSTPEFVRIRISDTEAPLFLQEEQGLSVGLPLEYYFNKTDRFSSIFVRPSINLEKLRFNDLSPTPVSNFSTQWKATLFTQLNIRLMQRPRDIQPASGAQLFAQIEDVLNNTTQQLTFNGQTGVIPLSKRHAYFYGTNFYLTPLPKTNQTLLLSAQFLNQSDRRLFSNSTIIPFGFDDDIFATSSSIGRVSSRYTIPLAYPDKGGMLVPFYVSNVFMSLFSHTLLDFDSQDANNSPTTLVGAGLHFRFKISNLALDLGLGVTYDLSRNQTDFILGSF